MEQQETKRDKFVRLAESRTSKTLHSISTIGNLANRNAYMFTDEDIKKIKKALLGEIDAMVGRFDSADTRSRPKFSLGDGDTQRGSSTGGNDSIEK